MVGFPRLPLVHGETDDDASIHLHRQVGPAQPLRRNSRNSVDAQILEAVNNDSLDNLDTENINQYFTLYKRGKLAQRARDGGDESDRSYTPEGDESSTYNETEDDLSEDDLSDLNKFADEEVPSKAPTFVTETHNGTAHNTLNKQYVDEVEHEPKPYEQDTIFRPYFEREEFPSTREDRFQAYPNRNESPKRYSHLRESYKSSEDQPIPQELPAVPSRNSQTQSSSSSSPEDIQESEQRKPIAEEPGLLYALYVIGFVWLIFFAIYFGKRYVSLSPSVQGIVYPQDVTQKLSKLSDLTESLSKRQDFLESNHEKLSNTFNSRFESLNGRFQEVQLKQNQPYSDLINEFQALKSTISNGSPIDKKKLDAINSQLARFDSLDASFESIKSKILNELIQSLPEHIPVYYKNNKIHFVPEFHKFLYSFIDNYNKKNTRNETSSHSGVTWEEFLKENKNKLDSYLDNKKGHTAESPSSDVKYLNKEKFDKILKQMIDENNKYVFGKVNDLIDTLNIADQNNTSVNYKFKEASSEIFLSNLLEVFSKGTVKVNYADYLLGSRILGFLTKLTLNPEGESFNKKSIPRRLFLGWYDYLSSGGNDGGLLIKSPSQWKYNANNALLDNEQNWQCESNSCSIGVRLFNSIILTDIGIKTKVNDESENADAIGPPQLISIYVKPKSKEDQTRLCDHMARYRLESDGSSANKYLSKFVKIKEFRPSASQRIIHVKIPVSIVNLRIPIRDVYIELRSPQGTFTGMNNIRAYGITELNSYKYNEEFDTLLDKLSQTEVENENEYDRGEAEARAISVDYESILDNNAEPWDELLLGDDEVL